MIVVRCTDLPHLFIGHSRRCVLKSHFPANLSPFSRRSGAYSPVLRRNQRHDRLRGAGSNPFPHYMLLLNHLPIGICGLVTNFDARCSCLNEGRRPLQLIPAVAGDEFHFDAHVALLAHRPTSLSSIATVTRHTSLVTRHTSLVTRHTSHVTRHT